MKNHQMSKAQYLSDKYSHMLERVTNPNKVVAGRNYLGKPICSREEFIAFGLKDPTFNRLFRRYKKSRGVRRISPSVDRINPSKGYTLNNIQFITLSENSNKDKPRKWIVLKNSVTKKVVRFASTSQAAEYLNHAPKSRINVTRKSFWKIYGAYSTRYLNQTNLSDRP